jgi:ABC-type proline/glycine betaine transport system permease subunit
MTSRVVEDEAFVTHVADLICQHGLGHFVLVGLEVGRPLAFIAGQLLWVLQPALGLVLARDDVSKLAHLMEDPIALEHLINLLGTDGDM